MQICITISSHQCSICSTNYRKHTITSIQIVPNTFTHHTTLPNQDASITGIISFLHAIQIAWNVQSITLEWLKFWFVSMTNSNNLYNASSSSVSTSLFLEQTSNEYKWGNANWYIEWKTHFCFEGIVVKFPGKVVPFGVRTAIILEYAQPWWIIVSFVYWFLWIQIENIKL